MGVVLANQQRLQEGVGGVAAPHHHDARVDAVALHAALRHCAEIEGVVVAPDQRLTHVVPLLGEQLQVVLGHAARQHRLQPVQQVGEGALTRRALVVGAVLVEQHLNGYPRSAELTELAAPLAT